MKVAIIGAGVSGLSCAYALERYGITPVIFEKRSQIGEPSGFSGLWSRLVIRVNRDPIRYLKTKYDFDIKPLSRLRETIMISPNKRTVCRGNLGYTFRRGVEEHSLEKQIAAKIKTPVLFNSYIEIEDIRNEFDQVVVSTASPSIARHLGIWTDTFIAQARIAMVLGDFKLDSATVWFNEKYANKAFCYLIPNSTKEATLALLINNSRTTELDHYWSEFVSKEKINYTIIQESDTEHFCGFVQPLKYENISFIGNAAGFTDDLIGIGAFSAIESGILAAQAIAKDIDYNKLVKPIYDDIVKLHHFRMAMNTFDNSGFDKLIAFVGTPGIKQFIYNNPLLKLRYGMPFVRFYNKLKKRD